jgi:carbamoyltransferase
MIVVGISAFYHDSAAAIVRVGVIVAAAQEERFTRKKHDAGFPANALRYCVAEAGIAWSEIDCVTFYEKPFLKFERLLETYLAFAPRGFTSFRMAIPLWLKEKLFQKSLLLELLRRGPRVDWDRCCASPSTMRAMRQRVLSSPFSEAAILTMDGVGEMGDDQHGRRHRQHARAERGDPFPHSLGLLYSAFTYYRLQGQFRQYR